MIDNSIQEFIALECKTHVKFLGILLDSNLDWKFHIDNIALKINKIVGVIACLRQYLSILLYLSYGFSAWVHAAKVHLNKILLLKIRTLRLMYFFETRCLTQSLSSSLPKLFL